MHTNSASTWVRTAIRLRRALAVGAVALTLAGTIATPAEARDRGGAAYQANDAIDACFVAGGDPDVYEYGGSIAVWCFYEEGQGWDSVDFYDYDD
jgi:hypothetical protein